MHHTTLEPVACLQSWAYYWYKQTDKGLAYWK